MTMQMSNYKIEVMGSYLQDVALTKGCIHTFEFKFLFMALGLRPQTLQAAPTRKYTNIMLNADEGGLLPSSLGH